MIVLNLKLDKIYGFRNFEIDFSYPKKIVNSVIPEEHLKERERFRYKKAVILMGANATGKTSIGKALSRIIRYLNTDDINALSDLLIVERSSFSIDFVNEEYVLHRLCVEGHENGEVLVYRYFTSTIEKMDSYEMCVNKLKDRTGEFIHAKEIRKLCGRINARFSYPEIEETLLFKNTNKQDLLLTFKAVIGALDPTLKDVVLSNDLKDTFIIRRGHQEIIIQQGKLLNREVLSSGTIEGIDIAVFLAEMKSKEPCFYYCDERFSHIQSNLEQRLFGIMLSRIPENGQLIFTTHNTDMLDLNLPKHTYVFLRKQLEDGEYKISAISASEYLKRNTDSVRTAVENDVFNSLPDDSLLDLLEVEENA